MIGWRAHLGVIFPTPVPGRVVRQFYEAVPDGVDLTMSSLTIRQLSPEDLDEAMAGVERAAEQSGAVRGGPDLKGLGIRKNVDIRKLPVPVEYTLAREVLRASPVPPDGIYIPCGGWGSLHNIERLERDLGKPVVTWLQAMIWWALRQAGVREPIRGFGRLLATLQR